MTYTSESKFPLQAISLPIFTSHKAITFSAVSKHLLPDTKKSPVDNKDIDKKEFSIIDVIFIL
ncbi:unnamed protein product [Paramecium pentaurelia]|uniref:Uncharacterized protein n=1 Tax=Paramecium pentaurelia TaxID=43138 RepID=A0A8S1WXF6_9CILI|nr:unnamed protein product [Paramecium pentaurelia]